MKPAAFYVTVLVGSAVVGATGKGVMDVFTGSPGVAEETPAADSVHVDTHEPEIAAADPSHLADSDAGGDPGAGVVGEPVPEANPAAPAEGGATTSTAGPASVPPAEPSAVAPPSTPALPATGAASAADSARVAITYQRLARIFAAMQPEEAAQVLGQLDDAQLEGILLAMQERAAAPILAEMDPQRAAAVSRRALGGRP